MPQSEEFLLGYPPATSNTTYTPNQFFDVALPFCSRGVVRLVAYMLRKTLGWCDAKGNPKELEILISYRDLIKNAGISRDMIRQALDEAISANFIRCTRSGRPNGVGFSAKSALFELCWDETGEYTTDPVLFNGFFAGEGNRTYIPNVFFDYTIRKEPLAVIQVVGAIIRQTIGFQTKFGFRRQNIRMSFTELQRRTSLTRKHLNKAIHTALERNHIIRVEEGFFDPNAGIASRAAVYGLKWQDGDAFELLTPPPAPPPGPADPKRPWQSRLKRPTKNDEKRLLDGQREDRQENDSASLSEELPGERSEKDTGNGQKRIPERSEKDTGKTVRKGYRERSEKDTGERSEKDTGERSEKDTGYKDEIKPINKRNEIKQQQQGTYKYLLTAYAAAAKEKSAAAVKTTHPLVVSLKNAGFDVDTASTLAQTHSEPTILNQLAWLPLREPRRNRLGMLRKAIEQNWLKPERPLSYDPQGKTSANPGAAFAAHFYAGFNGNKLQPTAEPSAHDSEVADRFVERLIQVWPERGLVAQWGRKFGELVREKQRYQEKQIVSVVLALRSFGDEFYRQHKTRREAALQEALFRAQEAHRDRHEAAYLEYLRAAEEEAKTEARKDHAEFERQRKADRAEVSETCFLANQQDQLERFDSEAGQLEAFQAFFADHATHAVLDFWGWDEKFNPQRFDANLAAS